jgi:hypothetical protein
MHRRCMRWRSIFLLSQHGRRLSNDPPDPPAKAGAYFNILKSKERQS